MRSSKVPSALVATPVVVPSKSTVTAGRGSCVPASVTNPVIVRLCAKAVLVAMHININTNASSLNVLLDLLRALCSFLILPLPTDLFLVYGLILKAFDHSSFFIIITSDIVSVSPPERRAKTDIRGALKQLKRNVTRRKLNGVKRYHLVTAPRKIGSNPYSFYSF